MPNYDFDYWHDYEDMRLKRGAYDPRFDEEEDIDVENVYFDSDERSD